MFLSDLIEPLLMVICPLVSLIPEYGMVCVTFRWVVEASVSMAVCWPGLLSQALVFILLFFLETLCGIHRMELCLCVKCDGDFL